MSSDDIILIVKYRGKFEGYWYQGDTPEKVKDIRMRKREFKVDTIEQAIKLSQAYNTEYGYYFVNL